MYRFDTEKRVRYSETDKMGYLYYGNYAQYFEIGRVEMLRSLGLSYRSMEDDYKIMMPVVSLNMRYVRPAYYDDLIKISTTLKQLPEKFITFHTELYNQDNKLVNGGTVKLCFVHMATKETVQVPEILLKKLTPYFPKSETEV